jgi:hypothetical protein
MAASNTRRERNLNRFKERELVRWSSEGGLFPNSCDTPAGSRQPFRPAHPRDGRVHRPPAASASARARRDADRRHAHLDRSAPPRREILSVDPLVASSTGKPIRPGGTLARGWRPSPSAKSAARLAYLFNVEFLFRKTWLRPLHRIARMMNLTCG